jgi:hypothetical protein
MIRRGVHKSVQALEAGIRAWIDTWNQNPLLATSLFGDAAAAFREHRSAALDEHCWSCAALTES